MTFSGSYEDPAGGMAASGGFVRHAGEARAAVDRLGADVHTPPQRVSGIPGRAEGQALVERVESVAALTRELDMILARLSRDVERYFDANPVSGFLRTHGYRSPADLLAATIGGTRAEALRLLHVGRTLEEATLTQPAASGAGTGEAGDAGSNGAGDDAAGVGTDLGPEAGPGGAPSPEPVDGPGGGSGNGFGVGSGSDACRDDDHTHAGSGADTGTGNGPDAGSSSGPDSGAGAGPGSGGPGYPYVAAALKRGEISIEGAALIMAMLDSLDPSIDRDAIRDAERDLTDRARGLSATALARIVRRFHANLDPAAHTRTLARLRSQRSLRMWENRDGMFILEGRFDPESAAPIRAALDALVSDAMRRSQESVGTDPRTTDQMRADAMVTLTNHALRCQASDLPLASVTVIVRVNEADLRAATTQAPGQGDDDGEPAANPTGQSVQHAGRAGHLAGQVDHPAGQAEIDGTTMPIDIPTLRRMAAGAGIIPEVLGTNSEILDFGRTKRLFSRAQRLALVERDGGCAFCGAPPAWTDVHHIRWWTKDQGQTNLDNGVLLCRHCHHTIHTQGWEITGTPTTITFTPPATIDPDRRPRPGGRQRFFPPRSSAA